MKKILGCLIVLGAFTLTMNSAFACEKCKCGCENNIKCNCEKECDCGCQNGEKCTCDCCKDCECENCCKKRIFKIFKKKCKCGCK